MGSRFVSVILDCCYSTPCCICDSHMSSPRNVNTSLELTHILPTLIPYPPNNLEHELFGFLHPLEAWESVILVTSLLMILTSLLNFGTSPTWFSSSWCNYLTVKQLSQAKVSARLVLHSQSLHILLPPCIKLRSILETKQLLHGFLPFQ